ncbi:hypothetical protein HJC23_010448 [Cyclotella cryptica]|uniref:Dirigent protein n=1 Tax=Cyclotella cryptica TaxID=29204 RepID=A0ABD3QIT0_9STRA
MVILSRVNMMSYSLSEEPSAKGILASAVRGLVSGGKKFSTTMEVGRGAFQGINNFTIGQSYRFSFVYQTRSSLH